MQKILIVVDMQNDFVTGPLGSEAAQVAAKNIAAHINEYDTVIFTRDTHGPDYLDTLEGKFLPVPHCIKDTEGWEIIPELVNEVSKVKKMAASILTLVIPLVSLLRQLTRKMQMVSLL